MKLHPSGRFTTPEQVLEADDLTEREKVEVLVAWANELRQLQVAEEENMRGAPGLAERLQAVERALIALGHEDESHDAKS